MILGRLELVWIQIIHFYYFILKFVILWLHYLKHILIFINLNIKFLYIQRWSYTFNRILLFKVTILISFVFNMNISGVTWLLYTILHTFCMIRIFSLTIFHWKLQLWFRLTLRNSFQQIKIVLFWRRILLKHVVLIVFVNTHVDITW